MGRLLGEPATPLITNLLLLLLVLLQSKELPQEYRTELQGLADGAKESGCGQCGKYITRGIVLANAPGDVKDFVYILLRELDHHSAQVWQERRRRTKGEGQGMKWLVTIV